MKQASIDPFRSEQTLLHCVTLNTRDVSWYPLDDSQLTSLVVWLPVLKAGYAEIPFLPGFQCAAWDGPGSGQFILGRPGAELATGAVAWGEVESAGLWSWLCDYYDYRVPRTSSFQPADPRTPPPVPWVGLVLAPDFYQQLSTEQEALIEAIIPDLPLALIQRALRRN